MTPIYLIEGPVGAGKSTYGQSLALQVDGVHMALDQWFAQLFSPDRPSTDLIPRYVARKARLLDVMWGHAQALVAAGVAPVLELGLIQRAEREDFYRRTWAADIAVQVRVLEASRETRRERVKRRNEEQGATFAMVVSDAIFEMASDLWQRPDEAELAAHAIEFIATDADAR